MQKKKKKNQTYFFCGRFKLKYFIFKVFVYVLLRWWWIEIRDEMKWKTKNFLLFSFLSFVSNQKWLFPKISVLFNIVIYQCCDSKGFETIFAFAIKVLCSLMLNKWIHSSIDIIGLEWEDHKQRWWWWWWWRWRWWWLWWWWWFEKWIMLKKF